MRGKLWLIVAGIVLLSAFLDLFDPDRGAMPLALPELAGLVDPDKAARVAPQSAALPAPGRTLVVTASSLRMRAGPGTGSAVIGALAQGHRVTVLEQRDGWARVAAATPQGSAWVSARYLAPAPSGQPTKLAAPAPPKRQTAAPSSAEITRARQAIIRQSIAAYPGSCPCPYNVDRGGRRCGGRSAWSRPGGYAPVCYDSDISEARLASYFARLRGAVN
ncbi:SH3 domain-containing protein [Oceanicola sp. S124]|uniref:SH3 domain-containing protein n=1 Tax=Oceanicola sp. S124 TaxID=1042378 RepID=UPI0002558CE4|nr:SH3 domain-containing protein [Oceanicola sp. S124]